jgi:hypothetical protein
MEKKFVKGDIFAARESGIELTDEMTFPHTATPAFMMIVVHSPSQTQTKPIRQS